MKVMTSSRPYLIRALYEWILDNEGIPHLLVDAETDAAWIPQEFVEDGKIIFDVSPEAVKDLMISNELIEFRGRFGHNIQQVSFPSDNVLAIYNEEGIGMFFEDTEFESPMLDESTSLELPTHLTDAKPSGEKSVRKKKSVKKKTSFSHLKIIK